MIAAFYLSYVIGDLTYQLMGNILFDPDEAFTCESGGTVIIPKTEAGVIYLLIHSALLLSFSVMVLLVFFRIPDHYRLVAKKGIVI